MRGWDGVSRGGGRETSTPRPSRWSSLSRPRETSHPTIGFHKLSREVSTRAREGAARPAEWGWMRGGDGVSRGGGRETSTPRPSRWSSLSRPRETSHPTIGFHGSSREVSTRAREGAARPAEWGWMRGGDGVSRGGGRETSTPRPSRWSSLSRPRETSHPTIGFHGSSREVSTRAREGAARPAAWGWMRGGDGVSRGAGRETSTPRPSRWSSLSRPRETAHPTIGFHGLSREVSTRALEGAARPAEVGGAEAGGIAGGGDQVMETWQRWQIRPNLRLTYGAGSLVCRRRPSLRGHHLTPL
ncbi:hypothetical protein H4V99_001754 [Cryobacterium sp. CG_9.6]|nr:hypothetical protein [Cryobacterium sp. CG_9.6]